jgi:16S rRNA C967 or C1407 C5-methylase (RsmB/RsmF family)/NOL1/NOP2/fmu family ribosome biogenesis protein
MNLPIDFKKNMQAQLGGAFPDFEKALQADVPVSIRFNDRKLMVATGFLETVKWSNGNGFYLKERPSFTLDPTFHAGAYYVQEASSMFVGEVMRQINTDDKALTVLDLCAAPGGKSTVLLSEMNDESLLVANEVIRSRYNVLQQNLAKWGFPNIAVTNHDSKDFAALNDFFDVVLVDAPCSGEGLFRKDKNARKEWSPQNVELCTGRSKRILAEAANLVKAGGYLIFSTCTYNDFENIGNAKWLTENFDYQEFKLDIPTDWGITEKELGYQFYPHRTKGEGFYLAIFQKNGTTEIEVTEDYSKKYKKQKKAKKTNNYSFKNIEKISARHLGLIAKWVEQPGDFAFFTAPGDSVLALPKSLIEKYQKVDAALSKKAFGIDIGTFKRDDFVPSQELALSDIINQELPTWEVDKETALQFLRKEKMEAKSGLIGWQIITYHGLKLGWVKVLKSRINNYYPKNWRILMR